MNEKNVQAIVDSPVRKQIHKKLVAGESVVWVLLECGDKQADDAAFETLTAEIEKLEKTIELPEIETEDLGDLSVDPNALKVAFSAVRVSRTDPNEQVLVEMLQRVEPDLMDEELASQPMAFPVFGRGRALYALIGRGIGTHPITDASKFLAGACQCTVKAQNPGVDLIMNVNWDEVVEPIEVLDEGLPPLAGFSGFVEALEDEAGDKPSGEPGKSNDSADAEAGSSDATEVLTTSAKIDDTDAVEAETDVAKDSRPSRHDRWQSGCPCVPGNRVWCWRRRDGLVRLFPFALAGTWWFACRGLRRHVAPLAKGRVTGTSVPASVSVQS